MLLRSTKRNTERKKIALKKRPSSFKSFFFLPIWIWSLANFKLIHNELNFNSVKLKICISEIESFSSTWKSWVLQSPNQICNCQIKICSCQFNFCRHQYFAFSFFDVFFYFLSIFAFNSSQIEIHSFMKIHHVSSAYFDQHIVQCYHQ